MEKFYPVSKPTITDLEKKYAFDAIESGWISSKGDYIEKFENAWATYNNYKYGVACNSGTNALYLALKALGIGEGDEVIVPDFTMVATAWAVTYTGATPVFVDCDQYLGIDVDKIEEKITSKTKVIIPVHIYGRKCNMEKIKKIAYEYNLYVVEDMAEAHGIKPESDIACYSFYGNKIITTGEGGMCLTNDERLAKQIDHLRAMGFDTEHSFLHKKMAFNFRMTNVQAAIGLAQVERIDEILAKRKQIEKWYNERLHNGNKMPERNVLWMYDVTVENNTYVVNKLKANGIEARHFFKPMSEQPMYKPTPNYRQNGHAGVFADRGLYLPTYYDLTEEDVDHICKVFKEVTTYASMHSPYENSK